MTVHTPSGKEYSCDMVSENPYPQRLYLHLTNTTMADVAVTVSSEGGLPFTEYPDYCFMQSIAAGPIGVNLALKKTYN